MRKGMFVVLSEMNQHDIDNNTSTLQVSGSFVSANKVKQGAHVTMGVPESCLFDIMNDNVIPVLMLIDRKEWDERTK